MVKPILPRGSYGRNAGLLAIVVAIAAIAVTLLATATQAQPLADASSDWGAVVSTPAASKVFMPQVHHQVTPRPTNTPTPTPRPTSLIELVGQIGGSILAVEVHGNYAYVGVGPRLVITNVSDPAHPAFVGQGPVLPVVVQDV
ncbi:MAG: hypothetical protein WAW26_26465, partial [Anaerolineae bacterium]